MLNQIMFLVNGHTIQLLVVLLYFSLVRFKIWVEFTLCLINFENRLGITKQLLYSLYLFKHGLNLWFQSLRVMFQAEPCWRWLSNIFHKSVYQLSIDSLYYSRLINVIIEIKCSLHNKRWTWETWERTERDRLLHRSTSGAELFILKNTILNLEIMSFLTYLHSSLNRCRAAPSRRFFLYAKGKFSDFTILFQYKQRNFRTT